ncbi:glycosyltransferase family 9 protein [Sulfuricurvum sp.]|uniref:glycosyltransferase family 9 protein n=1 Tax=Sulfuricurvum sp. TaxID=2025608 RepID=UPI00261E7479|nr:glycosyltransferase family 9 protein [Sulfuricurvum sp.]MDD3597006.1 glycosyltransferase family 9 protein [Sulfuricurvum sp.]
MIATLKTLIKFIIYYIINFFISASKEIKPRSILLIRLDAIGDYVLFRNYIEVLKKSEKYKDYNITLLGNNVWKCLSEELDGEFIDESIWLDRNKFNKNFMYRYKKLKEITSSGYELVLSPAYSREFFYGDNIVKLIYAKEKIGSIGDTSNIKVWQKNISDGYYTKLIPAKNELMFEFSRNKEFFENFLHTKLETNKPHIDLKPKELPFELPQKYTILFIGASASFRKWNIERFAQVGMWLKEKYGYEIVLCGAPSDSEDTFKFRDSFKGEYIDLVGKTSLVDLLYVVYNGGLMLSNETSAPHFAVGLEMTNIFVISNGNHYGRFTPYPEKMAPNYHAIYHPDIEKDLNDYQKLSNSYGHSSSLDIHEISFETVQNKMREVLHG